jgi:hypothetical protein
MQFLDFFFLAAFILSSTVLFVIKEVPSSTKKTIVFFTYCVMLIFAVFYIRFSLNKPYSLEAVVEQAEYFAFHKINSPKCKREQYDQYTIIKIIPDDYDDVMVVFHPKEVYPQCNKLELGVDRSNLEMWLEEKPNTSDQK